MLANHLRRLYWTTNAKTYLGFPPGALVVVDQKGGGGFAGLPQVLILALSEGCLFNTGKDEPRAEPAEWPEPGSSVEVWVGGRLWSGYHYFDKTKFERSRSR